MRKTNLIETITIKHYWMRVPSCPVSTFSRLCNGKDVTQCRDNQDSSTSSQSSFYFLAKLIFMAVVGVILKPWRASLAAADCCSFSNSTNAMS